MTCCSTCPWIPSSSINSSGHLALTFSCSSITHLWHQLCTWSFVLQYKRAPHRANVEDFLVFLCACTLTVHMQRVHRSHTITCFPQLCVPSFSLPVAVHAYCLYFQQLCLSTMAQTSFWSQPPLAKRQWALPVMVQHSKIHQPVSIAPKHKEHQHQVQIQLT